MYSHYFHVRSATGSTCRTWK